MLVKVMFLKNWQNTKMNSENDMFNLLNKKANIQDVNSMTQNKADQEQSKI